MSRHRVLGLWVLLIIAGPMLAEELSAEFDVAYSEKTRTGGVPLAAILFDELSRAYVAPGEFDYDACIAGVLGGLKAGGVEERYREVIRTVAGTAGMVIREDVLDLLAGKPGTSIDLLAYRGDRDVPLRFDLR